MHNYIYIYTTLLQCNSQFLQVNASAFEIISLSMNGFYVASKENLSVLLKRREYLFVYVHASMEQVTDARVEVINVFISPNNYLDLNS